MSAPPMAPFSARNKGAHRQIDAEFPETARVGLLHLLMELLEKQFIAGWIPLARELRRIARLSPVDYDNSKASSIQQAKRDAEAALIDLAWDKVYDFCERLHHHLSQEVGYYNHNYDGYEVTTSKAEVQTYVEDELQRLFTEEELAFEFAEGLVRRRGRKHTVDQTTRAQVVLGDPRLANARRHYDKAMQFFRSPSKPDYENCVKEAVCAVEAAGKVLFPTAKAATLGDLAKWLTTTKEVVVP